MIQNALALQCTLSVLFKENFYQTFNSRSSISVTYYLFAISQDYSMSFDKFLLFLLKISLATSEKHNQSCVNSMRFFQSITRSRMKYEALFRSFRISHHSSRVFLIFWNFFSNVQRIFSRTIVKIKIDRLQTTSRFGRFLAHRYRVLVIQIAYYGFIYL